jgi:hypothetical protein
MTLTPHGIGPCHRHWWSWRRDDGDYRRQLRIRDYGEYGYRRY